MAQLPLAILFDADGTLYDSDELHFQAYKIVAKKLYSFDFSWEIFLNEIVRGSKKPPEILVEYGFKVDSDEFYRHKRTTYLEIAGKSLRPMPKLKTFLEWCIDQNIRRIVVSAATRDSVEASLSAIKLRKYFEKLISHEDIGDKKKPHPYSYEIGLKYGSLMPHQAIAIEDSAKGIASAKAAGLECIGIKNNINNEGDLKDADYIIHSYSELRDYLLTTL